MYLQTVLSKHIKNKHWPIWSTVRIMDMKIMLYGMSGVRVIEIETLFLWLESRSTFMSSYQYFIAVLLMGTVSFSRTVLCFAQQFHTQIDSPTKWKWVRNKFLLLLRKYNNKMYT